MKIQTVTKDQPVALDGLSGKIVRGVADSFQRLVYAEDDLLVSLSNSLKLHESEVRDSRTFIGRFMSLFTETVNPEKITVDGMRLMQICDLAQKKLPLEISPGRNYEAGVQDLRRLVTEAEGVIRQRHTTS